MYEPSKLLEKCLEVIEKNDIGPEERYQIFQNLSNMAQRKIKKFLVNFATKITYEEIFGLKLDPNRRDEFFKFVFNTSLRLFQDF